MTSTAVKNVGTMGSVMLQGAGSTVRKTSDASFQEVWNSQTDPSGSPKQPLNEKKTLQQTQKQSGESLRTREAKKGETQKTDSSDPGMEEMDEQDWERTAEVLGTAVQDLMQQIMETFQISEKQLQGLMNDLGMTAGDLLESQKLSALLLEVGGAQDSLSLLTNETLYADFRSIMDIQQELLTQAGEELQMEPEQLQEVLTEWNGMAAEKTAAGTEQAGKTQEPVLNITVETELPKENIPTKSDPTWKAEDISLQPAVKETAQIQPEKKQNSFGNDKQETSGREPQGNVFLQNTRNESFQAQVQQASQNSSVWDTDTQNIMRQIMDYMKIQLKPDVSNLEMQLHPQSLGTLHIQVASKNGVVTANFVAQNEMVKAALESQMVQLKESFAEQGVKVEAIEVTVQTHQFERNLDQGQGNRQQEEPGRRRTRRINLGEAAMEQAEFSDPEERLAADMMAANGNTVDYTV